MDDKMKINDNSSSSSDLGDVLDEDAFKKWLISRFNKEYIEEVWKILVKED